MTRYVVHAPNRLNGNPQFMEARSASAACREYAIANDLDQHDCIAIEQPAEPQEQAAKEAVEAAERRARRIQARGVELYDTLKLIAEKAGSGKRETINQDNAFRIAGEMNLTLIAIRELAASAMAQTLADA